MRNEICSRGIYSDPIFTDPISIEIDSFLRLIDKRQRPFSVPLKQRIRPRSLALSAPVPDLASSSCPSWLRRGSRNCRHRDAKLPAEHATALEIAPFGLKLALAGDEC